MTRLTRLIAAAVMMLSGATIASAQSTEQKQPSTYDKVWSHLTDWYVNNESPVVQRVIFTGRFQHDLALVDTDDGTCNRTKPADDNHCQILDRMNEASSPGRNEAIHMREYGTGDARVDCRNHEHDDLVTSNIDACTLRCSF